MSVHPLPGFSIYPEAEAPGARHSCSFGFGAETGSRKQEAVRAVSGGAPETPAWLGTVRLGMQRTCPGGSTVEETTPISATRETTM